MSFPVNFKNKFIDLAQLKYEQCPVYIAAKTYPYNGSTPNTMQKFLSEAAPTVQANKFVNIATKYGIPGRVIIITEIIVSTSGACNLALILWRNLSRYGVSISDFSTDFEEHEGNLQAAGTFIFDFKKNPLFLFGNSTLELAYWLNSTTGVNCSYSLNGFVVTDDLKLNANKLCCIIGDSIGGITTTTGDVKDDIWTFSLINKLRNDGIDIRHINKSVGGATVLQWNVAIQNGYFDVFDTNLFIFNLGTNDCTGSETQLTQTLGIDGTFKTEYKAMIMNLHYKNKNAAFILNTPTPNNVYGQTLATTGIYTGVKMIAAIRLEIISIVADLKLLGYNIEYADLSTLFDASVLTNYVSSDGIHPKVQNTHSLISTAVYNSIQNLNAW